MTSIAFRRMTRGTHRFFAVGLSFLVTISLALSAQGAEIVHEVQKGQNLGMIAKRYHTSAQAIREANKLSEKKHIYPGQKLRIVESDEHKKWLKFYADKLAPKPKRKRTDKRVDKSVPKNDKAGSAGKASKAESKQRAKTGAKSNRGERDTRSAKKRSRNERSRNERKKRSRDRAKSASKKRSQPAQTAEPNTSAASEYTRKPRKPGFVTLLRLGRSYTGQLVDQAGKVEDAASKRADRFMRSWRTGEKHEMDRRLYRLLAQVSDQFGGRKMVVISGFRPFRDKQFTKNSRHNHGKAIDFRVVGVPIRALFDYCRGFRDVGCGYYPNSGFIHMDVREHKTQWTDYSRPGQAPIYAHKNKKPDAAKGDRAASTRKKRPSKRDTRSRDTKRSREQKQKRDADKRDEASHAKRAKRDKRDKRAEPPPAEPKQTAAKSKSGRGGGKPAKKPN